MSQARSVNWSVVVIETSESLASRAMEESCIVAISSLVRGRRVGWRAASATKMPMIVQKAEERIRVRMRRRIRRELDIATKGYGSERRVVRLRLKNRSLQRHRRVEGAEAGSLRDSRRGRRRRSVEVGAA